LATISELLIKIGADNSGLSKALDNTKQQIDSTFKDVSPLNEMQGALTGTTNKVEALLGSFTKFAAMAAGGFGMTSLISASVEAGESLYQLQRRLGVTTAEAGEFKKILALTGGDADTASVAIMRMDKNISGSSESAKKAKAIFEAVGVSMTDQNGKLLPVNKQLEQLAEGYRKATEAGYGQEFIMNTLGSRGMALTKTLQNFAEAKENAAKVQSNGLIDPEEMHKLDQEMKVINMQLGQLKTAGGAAFAPIAKEFLPVILTGLQDTAKFIKENCAAIKETTKDVVALIAVYKSLQAARAIAMKVNHVVGGLTDHTEELKANESKETELTAQQERAIARRIKNIEKQSIAEERAYAKSVAKMEVSEEEKSKLIAKHIVQREKLAAEAAERERLIMTEMFAKINAERQISVAKAATAYSENATAAQAAYTRIVAANTKAAASANEIVIGNARAAQSEAAKAAASVTASSTIVASNTAAKAAIVETTVAQDALTASEVITGDTAVVQGERKVASEAAAKAAVVETTVAQDALTAAEVVTGNTAVVQCSRTAEACAVVTGAVGRLTSAVWALEQGWWGVFAAVVAVINLSAQRSTTIGQNIGNQYTSLSTGRTAKFENGKFVRVTDESNDISQSVVAAMPSRDDYDEEGMGDDVLDPDSTDLERYGGTNATEGAGAPSPGPTYTVDDLTEAEQAEAFGKSEFGKQQVLAEQQAAAEAAAAEAQRQQEEAMRNLFASTGNVMGAGGGAGGGGGSSSGGAAPAPVEYDVPIGEYVAQVATENFQQGDQWRGTLGNDVAGWCDDFTHEVYKQVFESLGRADPFDGVVNDDDFKAAGAYHDGSLSEIRAQLQPGDLIDTPGHVGIYIGNGMVRSRQSSAGINDLSLDDFDSTFGGIIGFGSIAEASGGQTVKSSQIHGDGATREAQEAARALANARKEATALMQTMRDAVQANDGPEYQTNMIKNIEDVMRKKQQINKIAATPGIDQQTVDSLNKELEKYAKSIDKKVKKKWREAFQEMKDAASVAHAQVKHDYEAFADAEFRTTLHKLDKEREAKEKALMKDKKDTEARAVINDWYHAQVEAALEKRNKSRQEAHEKYINWLAEEGRLEQIIADLNTETSSKKMVNSIDIAGQKKLAQTYVSIWKDAHGSMSSYIADVSTSVYSSLTDSMTEFIRGAKSAKSVLQDFTNSILQSMAKIAAQRLAASWMTELLGAFSSTRKSGFTLGTGEKLDPSFGYTGSVVTGFTKFAKGGIVTAPTLAMIGEAGENEAVIPLNHENLSAMGGRSKSGGMVVNITNKTDSKVSVQSSSYDEGLEKWVLDVVVDGASRNRGGFGTNLKTALGGQA
jgi:hypothetical protein